VIIPLPALSLEHDSVLAALGVLVAATVGHGRYAPKIARRALVVGGGALLGVTGIPTTDLAIVATGFAAMVSVALPMCTIVARRGALWGLDL